MNEERLGGSDDGGAQSLNLLQLSARDVSVNLVSKIFRFVLF